MASGLVLLGKSILIATCAGIAAWLPVALTLFGTDFGASFPLIYLALLGSFAVGLPIALLTLFLAGKAMSDRIGTVMTAANCGGFMLLLVTAVLGGPFGVLYYGVPSWIAANVFGLLGWFLILKPMREAGHV